MAQIPTLNQVKIFLNVISSFKDLRAEDSIAHCASCSTHHAHLTAHYTGVSGLGAWQPKRALTSRLSGKETYAPLKGRFITRMGPRNFLGKTAFAPTGGSNDKKGANTRNGYDKEK